MHLIRSQPEADLIAAACQARELAHRYELALEHLIEASAERTALKECAAFNLQIAEDLEDAMQARDILPREPDQDLEDLRKLGDQAQGWLDPQGARQLIERFAEAQARLCAMLEDSIQGDEDYRTRFSDRLDELRAVTEKLRQIGA